MNGASPGFLRRVLGVWGGLFADADPVLAVAVLQDAVAGVVERGARHMAGIFDRW